MKVQRQLVPFQFRAEIDGQSIGRRLVLQGEGEVLAPQKRFKLIGKIGDLPFGFSHNVPQFL